jgi:hypothetical protein
MSTKLLDLNLNPDERTLRQFGLIAFAGFGLLATCDFYEVWMFSFGVGAARMPLALGLAALAAVSALFSLVHPKANRAIYVGLAVLAYPIGFVVSYVVLGVMFFAIFAPIGALLRLSGNDPMQRGYRKDQPSYWSEARPSRSKETYFRQF